MQTKRSKDPMTVLFLCTGNSCRSQMAEGFARAMLPKNWRIYSAGVRAEGLNLFAVRVMKEAGVDISMQRSKTIESLTGLRPDIVVTLCDNAKELCPIYPSHVRSEHWGLPDPADAKGTDEEILCVYRRVRDSIKKLIGRL